MNDEYKHYIRTNENNIVIFGFSTAFPEIATVQDGDICIDENAPRHFTLSLKNENGQYIYKWENNQLIERTEEELFDLEQYKKDKINFLFNLYQSELNSEFSTNAISATPIIFNYDKTAQDRFTKKATYLSINPNANEIEWATKYDGFVIMTREQFIQVLDDAAKHEEDLAFKYLYAEANIFNAEDKETVDGIVDSW